MGATPTTSDDHCRMGLAAAGVIFLDRRASICRGCRGDAWLKVRVARFIIPFHSVVDRNIARDDAEHRHVGVDRTGALHIPR
jgi:hypothetical protein